MNQHQTIVRLTASGIMIALATVLSMVAIIRMPQGGSLTPCSMLPICMISIIYGVKWGLGTAFTYSLVQLVIDFSTALTWGLSKKALVICFVFDYFLAYTALGLSGIFRKHKIGGAAAGVAIACLLCMFCHIFSGATAFAIWMPDNFTNPWIYSIAYSSYLIPEIILTVICACILCKVPALKHQMAF